MSAHSLRLAFFCALLCLSRCSCQNDEQLAPDLFIVPDLAEAPDLKKPAADLSEVCTTILCGDPIQCCGVDEECVAETCTALCASGVRCGDGIGTCCGDGEVCLSAECIMPGIDCSDSFDCPEGQFCEPTLGKCLPQPMGPLCEYMPSFSTFDTMVEWEWTGHKDTSGSDLLTYANVCVTPIVGDVDHDGSPDVVFGAYPDTKATESSPGTWVNADEGKVRLVILDGKSGAEKLVLPLATLQLEEFSAVAIGNLDADPELEIVGLATGGMDKLGNPVNGLFIADVTSSGGVLAAEVRCSQAGGSLAALGRSGAPQLANLDDDPLPEIVVGGVVLEADCSIVFDANATNSALPKLLGCNLGSEATATNFVRCIPAIANVDGAGRAEIFGGNLAYTYDTDTSAWKVLWEDRADASTKRDGFVAIAELLPDATSVGPELVVVSNNPTTGSGEVYLRNAISGAVVWGPKAIKGNGGPPTVADFDGDGHPEFAAATLEEYIVFDVSADAAPDGILWKKTTQDKSSSVTGSSVFDFQGDGAAEVVYNDECYLRVYDGKTGTVLFEQPNSSRTATEYPIIVDVDGDNRSEFVVPSNNDMIGRDQCSYCPVDDPGTVANESLACGRAGLRAFGDPQQQWVRTRRIWNQHTYHVTNVDGDGTIPASESASWTATGLNNYRQNVQGAGIFNAPNLSVSLAADLNSCPTIRLKARVTNQGSLGVAAGVPVSFFLGTGAGKVFLGIVKTAGALLPGSSETVVYDYDPASGDGGPFDFSVTVDLDASGKSTIDECKEDDNDAALAEVGCMSIG